MDLFEAIKSRCSVREFQDRTITKEEIEKMIDAGSSAPTARAEEPWEFIAVTDKNILREMAGITDHGKFIADAACAVTVLCKETKYYLEDGCAATENILLAASGLGIGSCWVAGDKKPYCRKMLDLLSIPPGYKLVSLIALGYPKGKAVQIKKRQLSDMIHWDRF